MPDHRYPNGRVTVAARSAAEHGKRSGRRARRIVAYGLPQPPHRRGYSACMTAPTHRQPRVPVWLLLSFVCLLSAGCDYPTTTTTKSVAPRSTTSAPATTSVAVTDQSPVAAYGSAFSAVVAVVIALSGTFSFLRRPRLTLRHTPEAIPEDIALAANARGGGESGLSTPIAHSDSSCRGPLKAWRSS